MALKVKNTTGTLPVVRGGRLEAIDTTKAIEDAFDEYLPMLPLNLEFSFQFEGDELLLSQYQSNKTKADGTPVAPRPVLFLTPDKTIFCSMGSLRSKVTSFYSEDGTFQPVLVESAFPECWDWRTICSYIAGHPTDKYRVVGQPWVFWSDNKKRAFSSTLYHVVRILDDGSVKNLSYTDRPTSLIEW